MRVGLLLIALCAGALAMPGPAALRSSDRSIRLDRSPKGSIDPAIARTLESDAPVRHLLRAIATDLDRDGDVDVIATTVEEPVIVWLNDGTGHLARQRRAAAPQFAAAPVIESPRTDDPSGPSASRWLGVTTGETLLDGRATAVQRSLSPDRRQLQNDHSLSLRPRGPPTNQSA